MIAQPTGRYVTTSVAGESFEAFVPQPLPPRLAARQLAMLADPLREAEAALARLDLAGEMIPSLERFIYAFVRSTFMPRMTCLRCYALRWCTSSSRPSIPISTATAASGGC